MLVLLSLVYFLIMAGGSYIWCLHCERVYQKKSMKLEYLGQKGEYCAYPGCGGSVLVDGWPWSKIRKSNPDYPKVPEIGVVYPLYGFLDKKELCDETT